MRHGIVESMDCALLMKFLSAATDEMDEMLAAITATVKEAAEKRAQPNKILYRFIFAVLELDETL